MKNKIGSISDCIVTAVLVVFMIILVIEFVNDIITQTKIRNKIQDPTKCIMINKKYYCEVEK